MQKPRKPLIRLLQPHTSVFPWYSVKAKVSPSGALTVDEHRRALDRALEDATDTEPPDAPALGEPSITRGVGPDGVFVQSSTSCDEIWSGILSIRIFGGM